MRCATDDLSDYGSMITQIVGHADPVVRDWEIWNEPDTGDYFNGTPQQYARMLRTAHDAIKQVDPQANVLLGGISRPAGMSWLGQVFATPGADAAHAFDIANVHQRGQMISLAPSIAAWKLFLAGHGFLGPLWVTEHGYPSDPAYQYDPGYTSGPASQAAYLAASIPTLVDAGASEVFVTERDDLSGAYASEGVLGGNVSDPPSEDPQPVEKPSYATVAGVAACYLLLARGCPGTPPVATPSSAAMTARRGSTTVSVVTVSDPGATPLQLGPAALAPGASTALAIQQDSCPPILVPGQACRLLLSFHPLAAGLAAAALTVPSDSGALNVIVSGVLPSVSSLIPQLVFSAGRSATGTAASLRRRRRLVFDVANPLPAPVHIARTALKGADSRRFRLTANGCARTTLRAGRGCRVTVLMLRSGRGSARAELTLQGDGQPLTIPLPASAGSR